MMRGLILRFEKDRARRTKSRSAQPFFPRLPPRGGSAPQPPGCKVFIARPPMHISHTAASPVPRSTAPPARRLICAMLGVLLLLSPAALTSCGSGGEKDGRVTVVCTNFPCYDFARQLCRGTDAEMRSMLLPPGGREDATPTTRRRRISRSIARADVFVYVGGESDEWANGVIASADNEDLRIFRLTDAVKLREEEIPEGADEDHDHGEDGDAPAHEDSRGSGSMGTPAANTTSTSGPPL